jgi:hypothetical protein
MGYNINMDRMEVSFEVMGRAELPCAMRHVGHVAVLNFWACYHYWVSEFYYLV